MYRKLCVALSLFILNAFQTNSIYAMEFEKNIATEKLTVFKIKDTFSSKELGLILSYEPYSSNRSNRVLQKEQKQKTVKNHVVLKIKNITEDSFSKQIDFQILSEHKNKKGILQIQLPLRYFERGLSNASKQEIHILYIKSNEGYGLSALQTLIKVFEIHKELYQERTYFSLEDANISNGIQIKNFYEKLGFSTINKQEKQTDFEDNSECLKEKKTNKQTIYLEMLTAHPLYRPRYLEIEGEEKFWKRKGSIDEKIDQNTTPYWETNAIPIEEPSEDISSSENESESDQGIKEHETPIKKQSKTD